MARDYTYYNHSYEVVTIVFLKCILYIHYYVYSFVDLRVYNISMNQISDIFIDDKETKVNYFKLLYINNIIIINIINN